MRPKSLLLLALALGCGLVASIGISQVMDRNNKPQSKLQTVPIYIALHNINLGDPIGAAMLSLEEWPKDKVPRGAISKLEELEGRRPRTAIFEGEPILEGKLLAPGQIADPIRSIPKGMRLKTIAVDAEKSAAGLLGPGDRVDVQLFVRKDQRTGIEAAKSKIIL
ncbi:MAG: Flp pilus assembly protein CpaB, partial [Pirellulales bacterium]